MNIVGKKILRAPRRGTTALALCLHRMYGGNFYWLLDSVSYIDSFVGPLVSRPEAVVLRSRSRAVHDMYMYMIKNMCTCACACTCMYMHMCVDTRMYLHVHVRARVCMYMCVCVSSEDV